MSSINYIFITIGRGKLCIRGVPVLLWEGLGAAELDKGFLGCLIGPLRAHCEAVMDEADSNPLQAGNSQAWWSSERSVFSAAGIGVGDGYANGASSACDNMRYCQLLYSEPLPQLCLNLYIKSCQIDIHASEEVHYSGSLLKRTVTT